MNVCFWSYWAQHATRNAVQILTIDKMVTLVEMQDFYLKKRERHAVLNNVIWCHLLHWVSFLFCKKTQDMVLISCNFSKLSWNLINHTPVHNCVPRHFHIPEPWRFIVVIFYNRDTGRFIEHTMQHIWINKISLRLSQTNMCSPLELLLLHLDSLLMQQHYLLSSMGRFYLMKDSASLCMF